MQNKDTYCTNCGAMYGANNVCPNCGKHNESLQNGSMQNSTYAYNYNYNTPPQNYLFQNNAQNQLFAYLTQNPNFRQRNKKLSIFNLIAITSIIITVIMLALSCLSFYIIPPLKAENTKLKKIADENTIEITKLSDEESKAKAAITELTKTLETSNAIINELAKNTNADKPLIDRLQKTISENQKIISNLQKYDEKFYYDIIAYISSKDNIYYHKIKCTVMKSQFTYTVHSVEMAEKIGYKPCPQCQK